MWVRIGKISSENLMYFAIVMLIILTCFPITMCFPSSIRYTLQITAMFVFFIGLILSRNKSALLLFVIIVAVMLIRVFATWKFKKSFVSCAFSVYVSWAFAFYGFGLYKQNNNKKCKKIFFLLFALTTITAVTTIIGLQHHPLVVRELGRETMAYSGISGNDFTLMKWRYRLNNIAGWNQVYGMVYLVPAFIFAYIKSRKKIFIIGSIIVELCIIRSQLTFAVLLSIMLIVLSLIKPSLNKNKFFLEIILVMIGIIVVFNIDSIILLMVDITSNRSMTMLSNKLYDLYHLLNGINTGDSLARTSLYSKSIRLFTEHPLLGQSIHGVNTSEMFSYHSDFFDMLGYYGLFGVILVLIGFRIYYSFIKKTKAPKWFTFIIFLGFLGMYIFNPVWYSPQIFIGVFLMPAILSKLFLE